MKGGREMRFIRAHKTLALLALGMVAVLAAVGVPMLQAAETVEPTWAVLESPPAAEDALPEQVEQSGTVPTFMTTPEAARSVGELDGKEVFVAPAKDGGICFTAVDDATSYNRCPTPEALRTGASSLAWSGGEGRLNLVVAVPDAYDEVLVNGTAETPQDNFVLAQVPKDDVKIELKGDDVPTLDGDLNVR
jgi:hypothetical protein